MSLGRLYMFMCMFFCLGVAAAASQTSVVTYGIANTINAVAISGDYLWCATEGGVVRWNTKDFTYTIFTVPDGLANNSVKCIAVGGDGTVWAGMVGGASRYDGSTWKTFTKADGLVSSDIGAVAVDRNGAVWFAAYNKDGISRYENGVWTSFPDIYAKRIAVGLDNTIWFACLCDGIMSYDGKAWKNYEQFENSCWEYVSVGSDGLVWIGQISRMQGLCSFNGKEWNIYDCGVVQAMVGGPDGTAWIANSSSYGVTLFDSHTEDTKDYQKADGLISNDVTAITIGDDKVVWFGTNEGISRFDGVQWRNLLADCMPSNHLTALAIDSQDKVWVGTTDLGVSCFNGTQWVRYSSGDDIKGIVEKILTGADGSVWIRTSSDLDNIDDGFSRFDGVKWESFDTAQIFPNGDYYLLALSPDGLAWFGAHGSIASFDGKNVTTYLLPDNDYVLSIVIDSDGKGWVGAWSGVYRFDGDSLKSVKLPSWCEVRNTNLTIRGNYLYFLNELRLCCLSDQKCDLLYSYYDFSSFSISSSGEIWALGDDGLFRYEGKGWELYDRVEGFWSVAATDSHGRVWYNPSEGGLKCLTAPALGNIHGTVRLGETGEGIPGAVVVVTPGNHIIYTDELGNFQVTNLPSGSYTVKARIGVSGDPYHLEIIRDGVAINSGETTEVNLSFSGSITGIADLPAVFSVGEPYPNPFNPSTSIEFTLPSAERVSLTVFDITGRKVRDLVSGPLSAGSHTVSWDGRDENGREISSGVYIARIIAGQETASRKMSLLR